MDKRHTLVAFVDRGPKKLFTKEIHGKLTIVFAAYGDHAGKLLTATATATSMTKMAK
ncbi:hypothetical protein [Streptomyces sp. NPDC060187]|uniref:hypothetical protein n=1 Tax=Streptomyces sp. NPDC060187 TaxID=3347067 RepID=UPI00365BBE69